MEIDVPLGKPELNSYEPIELNFVRVLEYEELDTDYTYEIYDIDDLTSEILCNRAGTNVLVVGRVIGRVTDGYHGQIINIGEGVYNYISYKWSDLDITEGTIILSYMIYNPNNNYEDDIINRYDYVLDRKFEVY